MHSCNNDEILLGTHDFVSLKQYTVENEFHLQVLNKQRQWTESHKTIIPCERCENSSKLHQIKTHFMTHLIIRCRNTCVSENFCVVVVVFSQNVVSM